MFNGDLELWRFARRPVQKGPPHLKSTDLLQEIHFLLEDGVNHLIEFRGFGGRPFNKKGFHFFIQIYRNLKIGDRAIKFPLFRLREIVFFLLNISGCSNK
jgi:hypothetical protein